MGMILGKETVAEPAYKVLLTSVKSASIPYEVRQYGERFAAETVYPMDASTGIPFRRLAEYIGVFGNPQNVGTNPIAMTAPVAMKTSVPIAMTAPVSMQTVGQSDTHQIMTFYLPATFQNINDIPKPLNPEVTIRRIPGAVGAVHRFSGSMDRSTAHTRALQLRQQLLQDGGIQIGTTQDGKGGDDDAAPTFYEAWGYNPPFTIPAFRRNEIWIELTAEQMEQLMKSPKTLILSEETESELN
jgi:SOUL heme-binding protein